MNRPPIYPFRRFSARFTDYMLWGMLTTLALSFDLGDFYSPLSLFYLSFCLYPLAEALLLWRFGTTLGKKLFGITVVPLNGLQHLTFRAALIRSYVFFAAGIGLFLPVVSLIAPLIGLHGLIKFRTTYWDNIAGVQVDVKPTSFWTKLCLTFFYLFLIFGSSITVNYAIKRDLNLAGTEEKLMRSYFNEVKPLLLEALSPDTVSSPQTVAETVEALEKAQTKIQQYKDAYARVYHSLQQRIAALPLGELRQTYQAELKAQKDRINLFFFKESIRISLFEKTLQPLEKADFSLVNGEPVFQDTRMEQLYLKYLTQLEAFLVAQDAENSTQP